MIHRMPLKFYGYLKKDLLLLVKRKKYLYLSILFPLIVGLLFLTFLSPGFGNIKVGICDLDNTEYSNGAFTSLNGFDPIEYKGINCEFGLIEDVKKGKIPLGVVIEDGFSDKLENLEQAEVQVYYDNTDITFANLVSWKVDVGLWPFKRDVINSLNEEIKGQVTGVRQSVSIAQDLPLGGGIRDSLEGLDSDLEDYEQVETEFIVNPVISSLNPLYEKGSKDIGLAYVFPVILLFIILMLSSTSLIYDVKSNFLTRVKSSTSLLTYMLAKLVFFFFVTIMQFVIFTSAFLAFGGRYSLSLSNLFVLLLSIAVINTLIGLIIGTISDNEGIAILFSLIISFPFMLLSGIFFPIQTLPGFMQVVAKVSPLAYQISSSKATLLFSTNIGFEWLYSAFGLGVVAYYLLLNK